MSARIVILRQRGCTAPIPPWAEVLDGAFWLGFSQVTGRPEGEARRWAFLCKTTDYLPEQAGPEDAFLRWVGRDGRFLDGEVLDGVLTLEGDVSAVYRMLRDNPWIQRLRVLQLGVPGQPLVRRRGAGHRLLTGPAVAVLRARLESLPPSLPLGLEWRRA